MSMQVAGGYVLAGGASRRMGKDKSQLPWRGITLGEWVAREVSAVAGNVTIAGAAWPGYRWIPDPVSGFGPVAGILSCLRDTQFSWNLIVACDLPYANRDWLRILLEAASGDVVVPRTSDGRMHPLCAVWNRSAREQLEQAAKEGVRRVHDVLAVLDCRVFAADNAEMVTNVNTPEEWACVQE